MMDVIIGNSGGVEGSNSIITYGHGKKVRGARGHLEKKRQRDTPNSLSLSIITSSIYSSSFIHGRPANYHKHHDIKSKASIG